MYTCLLWSCRFNLFLSCIFCRFLFWYRNWWYCHLCSSLPLVKVLFSLVNNTFTVIAFNVQAWVISVGSDKKWEIPHRPPIVKITHFGTVMSIDMTLPKWVIFTVGVYGEILCLLSDPTEICLHADNVFYFLSKVAKTQNDFLISSPNPIVWPFIQNRLVETIQMNGHYWIFTIFRPLKQCYLTQMSSKISTVANSQYSFQVNI